MTHPQTPGWTPAITRNRTALLRIVAALFAYAGLDEGGADFVPRRVWRRIVRLLRPAESAVRRLIVVAARGLDIEVPKPRPEKAPAATGKTPARPREDAARPHAAKPRTPAFSLTDLPRRFDRLAWEGLRPFPEDGFELADPDEDVKAAGICRRVLALKRALDDLDGHAKRLARREARRELASRQMQSAYAPASNSGQQLAAYDRERAQLKGAYHQHKAGYQRHRRTLRLGHPPGHCRRPSHEIDDILRACHAMAVNARRSDSS